LRSLKALSLFLVTFLLSCRQPTQLQIEVSGVGLGENALFLHLQFFDPGVGEPFDELVFAAGDESGIPDGAIFTIQIDPPAATFDVEVAIGAFSVNENLLGAGRSAPVTINFQETSGVSVLLLSPGCGDGYFDNTSETCDDGGNPDDTCPDECQDDLCGDGRVNNLLEECDFGDQNGDFGNGCNESCRLDPSRVFAARTSPLSTPAQKTIVLESGTNEGPDLLAINLNGSASLFAISGEFNEPISDPTLEATATQRFVTGIALDLAADTFPELLLLDTLASELVLFENLDGSLSEQTSTKLPLLDPATSQPVVISDIAALSGSLVLLAPGELWILAPNAGVLDLNQINRVPLSFNGEKLLIDDLTQDGTDELIVAEGNDIEIFDSAGLLLRSFTCGDDGSNAPIVDLDTLVLEQETLLATRQDGRLCLFQIGTPDAELKFVASTDAISAAVMQEASKAVIAVGQSSAPIGVLFEMSALSAPTELETIALSGGTGNLSSFDLDGDQLPDLLSTATTQSTLAMFFHKEDGALHVPRALPGVGALQSLTVADLNNNNRLDLVAASPSQFNVFLDAEDLSPPALFPGASNPTTVQIIDEDDDGNADVIISDTENHALIVLHGDGLGNLSDPKTFSLGAPFGPLDVRVANFDNIIGLDWLVLYDDTSTATPNDGDVLVYLNVTGNVLPTPIEVELEGEGAFKLDAKDLNFDFIREAVITSREQNFVEWIEVRDTTPTTTTLELEDDCSPVAGLPAEFSEDGQADIVVICGESGDLYYQESPTDLPPPPIEQEQFALKPLRTATFGDINGDAHLDLLAASEDGDLIFALGKGDGKFTLSVEIPGSQSIASLLVAPTPGQPSLFFTDELSGLLIHWPTD
jgi:hypothetical protein